MGIFDFRKVKYEIDDEDCEEAEGSLAYECPSFEG